MSHSQNTFSCPSFGLKMLSIVFFNAEVKSLQKVLLVPRWRDLGGQETVCISWGGGERLRQQVIDRSTLSAPPEKRNLKESSKSDNDEDDDDPDDVTAFRPFGVTEGTRKKGTADSYSARWRAAPPSSASSAVFTKIMFIFSRQPSTLKCTKNIPPLYSTHDPCCASWHRLA